MAFKLHPQLKNDTFPVGDLPLCQVLLMKDARFTWLIMVPRRDAVSEVFELNMKDQQQFWHESALVAEKLKKLSHADKINLAALGNQVPQLHMHVIARFQSDAAWPLPVWGQGDADQFTDETADQTLSQLREMLDGFWVSGQQTHA
ncbi:HIT family hydrolase, diadenosine tetraphosphate hydrolase [Methylophaga frappieri]|uniref:HIT family hydrolase, diadenosine tetraphosphate hydrolase n=1 Tax=Methylophaga frappieri (strain ATCC BAA-2434 / DSM 25690 / JAM7) TaxID=754477 RepID=I1YEI5_METFJ|nr:HIT family protein [Methylophaga frappieri]AFJ01328.1 HIT family hydrolase, diadenosine tetraphosphate hydrolase [Methylophaga frappieri]